LICCGRFEFSLCFNVNSKRFSKAEYPLYFLDYETYASVIPTVDGARPQSPIPFQYSLHIKRAPDGSELVHVEYLAEEVALPRAMVDHKQRHIGPTGSALCRHRLWRGVINQEGIAGASRRS
jgi:hypothetical protein